MQLDVNYLTLRKIIYKKTESKQTKNPPLYTLYSTELRKNKYSLSKFVNSQAGLLSPALLDIILKSSSMGIMQGKDIFKI